MPRLTKQQTKQQKEAEALRRKTLIDEYGRLEAAVAPHKATIRRLEELGKAIRAWYADADPEQGVTLDGAAYAITLGPCGFQTSITSLAEVYLRLGHAKFLAACSMTIKQLESKLPASEVLALTKRERTGSRQIVTAAKAAA